MFTVSRRRIEPASPEWVTSLHALGQLPALPEDVEATRPTLGSRSPKPAEISALRWHVALDTRGAVVGVLGWSERFEHFGSRDVIEVVHVAGSRRAVVDLLRFIQGIGRARCVPVVGDVALENHRMTKVLQRLGWTMQRVGFG